MKELSIEEKAKAYDRAFGRAKGLYAKGAPDSLHLEEMFPELKESEDSKMIRIIEDAICTNEAQQLVKTKYGLELIDLADWLEKQGEHANFLNKIQIGDKVTRNEDGVLINLSQLKRVAKPTEDIEWSGNIESKHAEGKLKEMLDKKQGEQKSTDNVEPNFHEGNWIVDNCGDAWEVKGIMSQFYLLEGVEGDESIPLAEWVDNTSHLWTIQDAKDGDVLACNEEILLFKSYSVQGRISLYCWYNGQTNNFHSKEVVDTLMTTRNKICPATKEQRDTLIKAMTDAGYTFDFEKKELKKIEQQPAWSREDE